MARTVRYRAVLMALGKLLELSIDGNVGARSSCSQFVLA
jgi:hypothetical protein